MNDFWNPGSFQITARSGCEIFIDGGGASLPGPVDAPAAAKQGTLTTVLAVSSIDVTNRNGVLLSKFMY
jgi:hypothetical protein